LYFCLTEIIRNYMAQIELLMPKMGESIMEATILSWLKSVGDQIKLDESILEIATDKVDTEVPSPASGILSQVLFNEGDTVEVGQPIAIISTDGEVIEPVSAPVAEPLVTSSVPEVELVKAVTPAPISVVAEAQSAHSELGAKDRFYSPLVLNIARSEGISMSDLERIPGTGKNARVTKKDILSFVSSGSVSQPVSSVEVISEPKPQAVESPKPILEEPHQAIKPAPINVTPEVSTPKTIISGGDEIVEMDRMRKLIADHMVMSKKVSPHVTSFVEADVTNIVKWRNKVKADFQKREGQKITYTPIFMEAVIKAIKDFPGVNVSVDGNKIIHKKNINLGMATALPSGNLIVPVIKNADQFNLMGLTKQVNDLALRARENKLKPDDIQGGTYTVTNVGTFGNVMGTPIINQPQVAILALGAIRKKPAVIETPDGDSIGIRHMMFMSHAYDHRVVDGFLGGSFVRRVADYLEAFDPNREI